MADCDCIAKCPFFNDKMANMPSVAEGMKKKYCHGNFMSCARHMVNVALGSEKVPGTLFPHQVDKAQEVIAAG